MKKYEYLIFDADHTLIDFEADEREAFRKLFGEYGVTADGRMLARCRELSVQTWDDAGLSNVDDAAIQKNYHELYRSHLTLLFTRIFREYPCFFRDIPVFLMKNQQKEFARNNFRYIFRDTENF